MPSDANGVYSLPAGYLATAGAKVKPSQHNPIFEDIAAAMSARLLTSGAAPMTGQLLVAQGLPGIGGLGFAGAANTGIFKTPAGLGVFVGGVQVSEFTPVGILNSSRFIGELIPWSRFTAPPLCVLPCGQTLSRVTYAGLWAVAQVEIGTGGVFFNNGDGVTTFGIADLRGRVLAAKDNMGGTPANVLTVGAVGINSQSIGAAGGSQTATLTLGQLPTGITSANAGAIALSALSSVSDIVRAPNGITSSNATGGIQSQLQANTATTAQITSTGNIAIGAAAVTSNNTSGNAHPIVQPTLIINYALFAGA